MTASSEPLHRRLREMRSRAAIQRWEMAQRAHAGGAWYRLARLLTYARAAWSLSEADAERLIAAGHVPEPAGIELEPPRRVFVVAEDEIANLPGARPVPLVASPELLACRALALVPFGFATDVLRPVAGSRG